MTTDIVERLRERETYFRNPTRSKPITYGPLDQLLDQAAAAEIERLREALSNIADGTIPAVREKPWRNDGKVSKLDKCPHGQFMYEDCEGCLSDYARSALTGEKR